jgi:hypothetical protein
MLLYLRDDSFVSFYLSEMPLGLIWGSLGLLWGDLGSFWGMVSVGFSNGLNLRFGYIFYSLSSSLRF